MKGLKRFLRDTWWVFGAAAVLTVVMAQITGWTLYYLFLPVLAIVAFYMSAVRYDRDGNERFPQPTSRRQQAEAARSESESQ